MGHDIFISYSSKDKHAGDAACNVLEGHGIRCWMAPRDIVPGAGWAKSIVDAITSARVMVLILSGNANASPQIEREVERAIHKGIPIIPFRIEDVTPSDALEYFLSAPHWLDAFTPPLAEHLDRLAEAVKTLLSSDYVESRSGSAATRPDQARAEPTLRSVALGSQMVSPTPAAIPTAGQIAWASEVRRVAPQRSSAADSTTLSSAASVSHSPAPVPNRENRDPPPAAVPPEQLVRPSHNVVAAEPVAEREHAAHLGVDKGLAGRRRTLTLIAAFASAAAVAIILIVGASIILSLHRSARPVADFGHRQMAVVWLESISAAASHVRIRNAVP